MTASTETVSPFLWHSNPRPSIFATKEALTYAKTVETSQRNAQAQRAAAPFVMPKIRSGRPPVDIDTDRLKDLHSQGLSLRAIAREFGCDHKSIVNRLLALEGKK